MAHLHASHLRDTAAQARDAAVGTAHSAQLAITDLPASPEVVAMVALAASSTASDAAAHATQQAAEAVVLARGQPSKCHHMKCGEMCGADTVWIGLGERGADGRGWSWHCRAHGGETDFLACPE